MNDTIIPPEICEQDRDVWHDWAAQNGTTDATAIIGFYVTIKKPILTCLETDIDFYGLVLAQFLNTKTVWARLRTIRAYWTFAKRRAEVQG